MAPHLVQLAVSKGGVPKRAIAEAEVGPLGLAGDVQRHLEIHGGPERAVCLYSAEVIDALRAEGHPIAYGTAGENMTIAGLDWPTLAAGQCLRVGAVVVLELTRDTTPCRTIMPSFKDRKFSRISHQHHPGWSRWYARVLVEGTVRVGDPVAVYSSSSSVVAAGAT